MSCRLKKIVYCSCKEFNQHLKFCKMYRNVVFEKRSKCDNALTANIEVQRVNISLTYRRGNKTCTYCFRLDADENPQKITGLLAYQTICKYYKVPNMTNCSFMKKDVREIDGKSSVGWIVESAIPLLYSNPEFSGTRIKNCYEYDLVSAYGWALTQPIPDTTKKPRFNGKVKEGEIGFLLDGTITFSSIANIIFPLMESPFKGFVNKWFAIKKSGDKELAMKGKQMLNYAVGYMQRTNPFIRNTIVNRCSNLIEELIDENTLYCNTDSLISRTQRDDIMLKDELGCFQIKHSGTFAYIGYSYQWNNEVPIYRGVPKKWFNEFKRINKRPWDILLDDIPGEECNQYFFDTKNLIIRRRKNA